MMNEVELRDYFAGQVLVGMLASTPSFGVEARTISDRAYVIADAMLVRRLLDAPDAPVNPAATIRGLK